MDPQAGFNPRDSRKEWLQSTRPLMGLNENGVRYLRYYECLEGDSKWPHLRLGSRKSFSWQDYVTVVLAESGHVAKASIQRLKDGVVWASTRDFCLSQEEVKTIKEGFLDDTEIRQEGLIIDKIRYTLTRLNGQRVMVGRRTTAGEGCILYLCGTCLLCGLYSNNNHPGHCYAIITQLGDYLVEKGF